MTFLRVPSKDEKEAKPYILRTILFGLLLPFAFIIVLIPFLWLRVILALLWGIVLYETLLGIISILIVLSQKKDLEYNYHFEISLSDVLFWVENAMEPDEIVIEQNDKKLSIDIQFDIKGNYRNGKFVDKGIYIDKVEYSISDGVEYLKKVLNDTLYVVWYTENNNPVQFKKVIDELKEKSQR